MVANQFFESLSKFHWNAYIGVDDFADRVNFLLTVIIILICISVVTIRQYVLKPISCYLSTDIGGVNLLDYVENFCWIHGTIPISYNGSTPSTESEWEQMERYKILYYQWVPFVLGIQCILFHLPKLLWNFICYNQTGTDIQHIIMSANEAIHSNNEIKDKMVSYLARIMEDMLFKSTGGDYETEGLFRKMNDICTVCAIRKHFGNWIFVGYFCIKTLYIVNAVGQLFLMRHFLGLDGLSSFFGLEVLGNLLDGKDWQITLIFPRVAFCYAKIRHLGAQYNAVMAQCVLPVNMLNEKIYIFLWHWILFCAVFSCISLLNWIHRIVSAKHKTSFIRKLLVLNDTIKYYDQNHERSVEKFTKHFLKYDGVFLLRMMFLNVGGIITGEVLCKLWTTFNDKYHQIQKLPNENRFFIGSITRSPSQRLQLMSDLSQIPNGYVGNLKPSAPIAIQSYSDKDSFIV